MKISELLSNNDLDLKISSSSATGYRAELYWKNEPVELEQGYCVISLFGTGNTMNEAIEDLITEISRTHRIKVNKNTQEDSYYININDLYS